MRVELEPAGKLVFAPDDEHDRNTLAQWWAQLQTMDEPVPPIISAHAERALILFVPQR